MSERSVIPRFLLLCLAVPRSGLGLLSGCLRLLGARSLDEGAELNAPAINRRLLRDLGLSPLLAEPLPEGWLSTPAADLARERLVALVAAAGGDGPGFVCDPLLCRTLPLWLSALPRLGYEVRPVFLLRHPHEVALSLRAARGLDLADGHALWQSWTRSALAALEGRDPVLLTLDQLLADPVTPLAGQPPADRVQALLDFVRPEGKRHRESDLAGEDRERHASLAQLYDWLRLRLDESAGRPPLAGAAGTASSGLPPRSEGPAPDPVPPDRPRPGAPDQPAVREHFHRLLRRFADLWEFHEPFRQRAAQFAALSARRDLAFVDTATFFGAPLRVFGQGEVVSSRIHAFGLFEPEICAFFVDYLFDGAVVCDVGAHVGFFSRLGAALVGPRGRVFAFEPTPATLELLRHNLADLPQATVVPALVWDAEGNQPFSDFGPQFCAFNTAAVDRLGPEERETAQARRCSVPALTLDGFCRERGVCPDLVKIDAESAEMRVLAGMERLLTTARPVIILEVGDLSGPKAQGLPTSRELLDYVMARGYLPLETVVGRYQGHVLRPSYAYDNLTLVPVEKLPERRPLGAVAVERGRFF